MDMDETKKSIRKIKEVKERPKTSRESAKKSRERARKRDREKIK